MLANDNRGSHSSDRWPHLRLLVAGCVAFHAFIIALGLFQVGSGRVSGDWTAFYAAGTIIREGGGRHLYDLSMQRDVQQRLFGSIPLDAFPLPPFAAFFLAPFTLFSYKQSYFIWVGANAILASGLLVSAWQYLRDMQRRQRILLLAC